MGAYWMGEIKTTYDIIEMVEDLLTRVGWTVLATDTLTYNSDIRKYYGVWRGTGDGNDNIYIQMRAKDVSNILLDSMVGYDNALLWYEQPGSIQQMLGKEEQVNGTINNVKQPMFSFAGESECYCWLFATSYHIVGVVRMSTEEERTLTEKLKLYPYNDVDENSVLRKIVNYAKEYLPGFEEFSNISAFDKDSLTVKIWRW